MSRSALDSAAEIPSAFGTNQDEKWQHEANDHARKVWRKLQVSHAQNELKEWRALHAELIDMGSYCSEENYDAVIYQLDRFRSARLEAEQTWGYHLWHQLKAVHIQQREVGDFILDYCRQ